MWPVPDVNHVSGTDLLFLGGPGRNRTTDTRIFNSDRPSSLFLFSKSNSVPSSLCASVCIFFFAVKKYLYSIATIPLIRLTNIFLLPKKPPKTPRFRIKSTLLLAYRKAIYSVALRTCTNFVRLCVVLL